MLKCPNCGEENTFGRVFCMGCGSKLDLSTVNEMEIEEMGRERRLMSYWPVAVLGLVVLIVVIAGLAFWPPEGQIGDLSGSSSDGSIVKSQLSLLSRMSPGRKLKISFTDKQLNKYLETYVKRQLKSGNMSVEIDDDRIEVRHLKQFGPFGPEPHQQTLDLVLGVKYAAKGDKLAVKGGSIGHLPLPGPLGHLPHSMLKSTAKNLREKKSMKYLKEISIEDGRISLHAAR